jgi:hypothetical protein
MPPLIILPFYDMSKLSTQLIISTNTTNYNVFTALGSPTSAVNVTLTINTGIYVYSTSTSNASITTGALPTGSTLTIINNGYIIGKGGDGGVGRTAGIPNNAPPPGGNGGTALNVTIPVTIDNTNGIIGGGGGGGGGGGSTADGYAGPAGGCGGGGGAGNGIGGGGSDYAPGAVFNNTPAPSGNNGTLTTAGTGGIWGTAPYYGYMYGGNGGNGGSLGSPGIIGSNSSNNGNYNSGGPGLPGNGGNAIKLNGNSITWSGGNNTSQVLGAVS